MTFNVTTTISVQASTLREAVDTVARQLVRISLSQRGSGIVTSYTISDVQDAIPSSLQNVLCDIDWDTLEGDENGGEEG